MINVIKLFSSSMIVGKNKLGGYPWEAVSGYSNVLKCRQGLIIDLKPVMLKFRALSNFIFFKF
jgi:hypothetical protein